MKPTSHNSALLIFLLAVNAFSIVSAAETDHLARALSEKKEPELKIINTNNGKFLDNAIIDPDKTLLCTIISKKDLEKAVAAQEKAGGSMDKVRNEVAEKPKIGKNPEEKDSSEKIKESKDVPILPAVTPNDVTGSADSSTVVTKIETNNATSPSANESNSSSATSTAITSNQVKPSSVDAAGGFVVGAVTNDVNNIKKASSSGSTAENQTTGHDAIAVTKNVAQSENQANVQSDSVSKEGEKVKNDKTALPTNVGLNPASDTDVSSKELKNNLDTLSVDRAVQALKIVKEAAGANQ